MAPDCSVAIITGQFRVLPGQRVEQLFAVEIAEQPKLPHPRCGGERGEDGPLGRAAHAAASIYPRMPTSKAQANKGNPWDCPHGDLHRMLNCEPLAIRDHA